MNPFRSLSVILLLAAAISPLAAVNISQFNVAVTENFDTLASVTSSTMPDGWSFLETGTSANTTYGAGTGSSATGNTYSFGASGSTDRSLGSLRTSGVAATFGAFFTNTTGATITQLTLGFTGEQWRLGALNRPDRLDFAYSFDATDLGTGTWSDVDALDFTGPVTSGVTGALDGDAAENQAFISHSLTGLNLVSGDSLWIRWVDFDASGSDDGLAIDNFSIMAVQSGGTGGEGGGGTTVPDHLPLGAIVAAFGGLLVIDSLRRGRLA